MSAKKEYPCAPNSGKRTIYLRWGLLWRTVAGSGKVVSDAPPAVAVGSSSMTITGTLALFAALWARVLKRNGFGVKQIRYKTKQQELKNYKYSKESYSSSSSSELSAERSKSGSPPVRRGGEVGSLARLAGAVAVDREGPAPVAAAAGGAPAATVLAAVERVARLGGC